MQAAELRSAFLAGDQRIIPHTPPAVLAAWERSRAAGVSPGRDQVPVLMEGGLLRDFLAASPLHRAGEPVLETAAAFLTGTGYGLILADAQGIVLHVAGDRPLLPAAERIGSVPGATWREDLVGNNAVGTSLVMGAPVRFLYHEHWCAGWVDWICSAAPVRDRGSGAVLGAISVCACRRPTVPAMLTMATKLAATLERQVERYTREGQQRLQAEAVRLQRWFPGQGVVVCDAGGAVVWWQEPLPPGLLAALREHPPTLIPAKLRGEREVLVGGRFPCLVIPVWDEADCRGHVLVAPPAAAAAPAAGAPGVIVAGTHQRHLVFTPDRILAARVQGGRVWVVTDTGEWPTPLASIRQLQERLPPAGFFQVDRGCLVNLARIKEIHPMFNRTVTLVLADRQGTRVPVSRRRSAALRAALGF